MVALLRHLARRAPLLLTIDDVHWLDERSVALLHYTARNLRGSVPLLVSSRPRELTDNPACRRMLDALRRAGAVDDLPVGPLPDAAVQELIRRVAPLADPNPIVRASNGNPLLALEMARAVVRGDDPLSGQVDTLIGDRLARLSERAAALVPWLATFGRSVRPTLLAAAYDSSVEALLEPLGELEEHGVVVAGPDGAYDLAHDLVRETIYRHLSTPRRIMLHRRIGRALAIAPDDDDILAADAARHADQADDGAICAAASARAACRCVRLLAYDEATEHVARGRRHARRLDARQRVVHEIRLIDVLLHPGLRLRDPGALRTELAELCALARHLGLVDELSVALTLLARVYHWGWGDIPRAGALLHRAVEVISRANQPMAEPLLQAARCLAYLEIDMPRTRALFDELARLGELAEASHQYHWGRGLVLAWSGSVDQARHELKQAIQFADARGDHWVQFECAARLALLEIEVDADATDLCAQLHPLAAKLGHGGSERQYARAISALARLDADDEPFRSSIDELTRIDARFLTPDLLGLAAEKLYRAADLPVPRPTPTRHWTWRRRSTGPTKSHGRTHCSPASPHTTVRSTPPPNTWRPRPTAATSALDTSRHSAPQQRPSSHNTRRRTHGSDHGRGTIRPADRPQPGQPGRRQSVTVPARLRRPLAQLIHLHGRHQMRLRLRGSRRRDRAPRLPDRRGAIPRHMGGEPVTPHRNVTHRPRSLLADALWRFATTGPHSPAHPASRWSGTDTAATTSRPRGPRHRQPHPAADHRARDVERPVR